MAGAVVGGGVGSTRTSTDVSGGLALRSGDEELGQTLSRADEALYAAKRAGRNRICG